MSDRTVDLGKRLREAREYLGFTREQVCGYLVGTSEDPIALLDLVESGDMEPTDRTLEKLARLYGHPVQYFTGEWADNAPVSGIGTANLDPEDRREVERFAAYLRDRKAMKKRESP